jgi:hypothetical protein
LQRSEQNGRNFDSARHMTAVPQVGHLIVFGMLD